MSSTAAVTTVADTASVGAAADNPTTQAPRSTRLRTSPPEPDPTATLWRLGKGQSRVGASPTAGFSAFSDGSVLGSDGSNMPRDAVTVHTGAPEAALPVRFTVLQKWEGVVLDVNRDDFLARLIDLTGNQPDQQARVHVDEISPRDRRRLVPGALLYWYVGYRDEANGDRERSSRIRLRRLPPLSEVELQDAEKAGERLRHRLRWSG